jgi:site-specific DNA-methyltransferase (adenine-specific)
MTEKTIIKQAGEHYDTIHPTQKPVRLLERLLALVTKEGDLVLDPFAGSGSTAIACVNTGRRFIGMEIDDEYHAAGVARVSKIVNATKQPTLF